MYSILIPDIIHEVVRHLDTKDDLANVRLVHPIFAKEAAELLFRVISVKAAGRSISRLLDIAHTPRLAPMVREVHLITSANVREMVWSWFIECLQQEGISDAKDQHRALGIFKSLRQEWYNFERSPDYVRMLSGAFAGFPRLEALELCDRFSPLDMTDPEMESYPSTQQFFQRSAGEYNGATSITIAFEALVNAAFFARPKITSFRADHQSNCIDPSTFRSPELMERAAVVFRECRVISLVFQQAILDNPLFRVLSQATHLRELHLLLNHYEEDPKGVFPLVLGTDHVWKHLTELNLQNAALHFRGLVEFLDRHKSTLRNIIFHGLSLVDGSWMEVMTFMKDNLKLLSLDVFYLEDPNGVDICYSDDFSLVPSLEDALVDYVLHGTEMPGSLLGSD